MFSRKASTRFLIQLGARCVAPTALFLALSGSPTTAQSPASSNNIVSHMPEFRAFWVDGFNPGFITPQQCDELIANVRAMHGNAVIVEMRKRGDAYYASHYEPWASDDQEHFDALAYLCKIAHERGKPYIQVHAWLNAASVGGSKNPRGIAALHPEWHSISDTGSDYDGESTKIDPGIPAAADWTYRVFMDVVRNYPVDGIHLDSIRYGGDGPTVGHWGYSPISLARYRSEMGITDPTVIPAWNDPRWQQWRRDQVTALVRRIYLGAKALRPNIIVSAATICWGDGPTSDAMYEQKSAAYNDVFGDWREWMREGILDLNLPMVYIDEIKHPVYWHHWAQFIKDHQYGHLSGMGIGAWLNTVPNSMRQITDVRTRTEEGHRAAGVSIFSYAWTDIENGVGKQYNPEFYTALKAPNVWGTDVRTPSMAWITHPTEGHIAGVALADKSLTPMDAAVVTIRRWRDGKHHRLMPGMREARADGNGFYGFPFVKPGAYDVRIDWRGHHDVIKRVVVKPGKVTQVPTTAKHRTVAGTGKLKDGTVADYVGVVVTNGSDRLGNYFYIADAMGKPPVRVDAPGLVMPTVAGDVVAIEGVVTHQGRLPAIDAKQVRFLGAEMVGKS